MPALAMVAALGLAAHAVSAQPDRVLSLPGYGAPKTKHFAGFSNATASGENQLFYYFVEAEIGSNSTETPLLIWLNGGPGASSMSGLFVEKLGPQIVASGPRLVDNPEHSMKKYHVMAVDNPVGAGYATTTTGAYAKSEEEVRTQFVHALRGFYKRHPEYSKNPLWVTGESYAGKYVPNIAYEIATNAKEIPLKGVVIGNGLYNEPTQYASLGEKAFGMGVIDEKMLPEVERRAQKCKDAIARKMDFAMDFCENITVRWLYTGPKAVAGELFYYDFGIQNSNALDEASDLLGKYLNRADVKAALHVGNSTTWQDADETGPVAVALRGDFLAPSVPMVVNLLDMGLEVFMYNGVRDGSVCNHIGNLNLLLEMQWKGSGDFAASESTPWPSADDVMGHIRGAGNLRFATIMRTGHLVPLVVPKQFSTLLDIALTPTHRGQSSIIV